MLSLIYPAFLGSFLVAYLLQHEALDPIQRATAAFLLVYFVVGFAETLTERAVRYNAIVFAVDVVEVTLMALLFTSLGVLPPTPGPGNRELFWLLLAALFLAPMAWRLAAGYSEWAYDVFSLAAVGLCLAARFGWLDAVPTSGFASIVWSGPDAKVFTLASDDLGISGLWILMLVYLVILVIDMGGQWSGAWDDSKEEWKVLPKPHWYVDRRTSAATWRLAGAALACGVSVVISGIGS